MRDYGQVRASVESGREQFIDTRSAGRFAGTGVDRIPQSRLAQHEVIDRRAGNAEHQLRVFRNLLRKRRNAVAYVEPIGLIAIGDSKAYAEVGIDRFLNAKLR